MVPDEPTLSEGSSPMRHPTARPPLASPHPYYGLFLHPSDGRRPRRSRRRRGVAVDPPALLALLVLLASLALLLSLAMG